MSENVLKLSLSRAQRIAAIVRKEISTLLSDKIAIFVLFILPVSMILTIGLSAPRSDLMATTIWIIDEDNNSTKAYEFGQTFKGNKYITVYATGDLAPAMPEFGETEKFVEVNRENAEKYLPTEYLSAYIVLPKGYEAELNANGTAHIDIYYDAIDLTGRMLTDMMILLGLTNVQLDNMLFERDIFYYPEGRPHNLTEDSDINILELGAPMFMGLMLFMSMNLVATQCIVGDTPLQRLLTTPVYRSEVITGKIIAYTIMGTIQIIISMLLLNAFNITMNCLWIDLFILLVINTIAGITLGVFISTISKSRLQASQMFLMFFFVMLIMQYYVRNAFFLKFITLEQTAKAYADLAYRGSTLIDVLPQIGWIVLTGLLFYVMNIIYIKYLKKEFV
jgi:ABC-2 type transport system permease protein